MSYVRKVSNPSEVVQKGQKLTCQVLSVDQERKRVALGLKQMGNDPWESDIPGRYKPGQKVRGKVTKLTNFGVFVELEPGLEGLLHISELSDDKIESPEEVVKVGDEVDVKVLRVDAKDRKIGLSHAERGRPDRAGRHPRHADRGRRGREGDGGEGRRPARRRSKEKEPKKEAPRRHRHRRPAVPAARRGRVRRKSDELGEMTSRFRPRSNRSRGHFFRLSWKRPMRWPVFPTIPGDAIGREDFTGFHCGTFRHVRRSKARVL